MGRRPDINGRELLMAAALRLFATEGIDAVSIRAVNRAAGLGPASMHYHFGTKEALVDAVAALHEDAVRTQVVARAEELAGRTGASTVTAADLVSMIAGPYLDLLDSHPADARDWIGLIDQLVHVDPRRGMDSPAADAARAAIARAYPHTSTVQADRALTTCFRLLISQLAHPSTGRADPDLGFLLEFLGGGLESTMAAPSTAETVLTA